MTAALVCDGPGCTHVGKPGSSPPIEAWWRVERHGLEWAEEVLRPHSSLERGSPVLQRFSFQTNLTVVDGEEEPEDDEPELDDEEEPSYLDSPPLHFCSVACLVGWGELAKMTEETP